MPPEAKGTIVRGTLTMINDALHDGDLPDNLTVLGDLLIHNNPITMLPNNLVVVGDLSIGDTKISELPESLKVGGRIYNMGTPLYVDRLPRRPATTACDASDGLDL